MNSRSRSRLNLPLLVFFYRPRSVIKHRLHQSGSLPALEWALIVCAGISSAFAAITLLGLGVVIDERILVVLAVLLGPLMAVAAMLFDGVLLSLIGRMFHGTASVRDIFTVYPWSNFPRLIDLAIWFALLLSLGSKILSTETAPFDVSQLSSLSTIQIAIAGLFALWMIGLWIVGLAEAHFFSMLAALGTLVLSKVLVAAMIVTALFVLPVALFALAALVILVGGAIGAI